MAKVHLTRGNFSEAAAVARDIVTNGPYSLQVPFSAVFDVNNENNAEVIFDIQYIRLNGEGSRIAMLAQGSNTNFGQNGSGGWGLQWIQEGFFEKYSVDDDRRNYTFSSIDPHPQNGRYYFGKWRDPNGVAADAHDSNFIVYRYADVLLILAEAVNEVQGPVSEAYDAINEVRARALLPDLTPGLSKDEFRDAVLFERHLELATEQHRWFDLKRTGRLQEVMEATGRNWDARYELFPIHQDEIDASAELQQNPGY